MRVAYDMVISFCRPCKLQYKIGEAEEVMSHGKFV